MNLSSPCNDDQDQDQEDDHHHRVVSKVIELIRCRRWRRRIELAILVWRERERKRDEKFAFVGLIANYSRTNAHHLHLFQVLDLNAFRLRPATASVHFDDTIMPDTPACFGHPFQFHPYNRRPCSRPRRCCRRRRRRRCRLRSQRSQLLF